MATTLPKHLTHSPLVYVLAQVFINPYEKLEDKYLPDIQEALRKAGYPQYRIPQTEAYEFKTPGVAVTPQIVRRYEFCDKTNTSGVSLNKNSFVYHTTAYTKFEDFLERFQQCLALVDNILEIDLFGRVGLRYVDLIDSEDGSFNKLLGPSVLGFPNGNYPVKEKKSQTVTLSLTEHGALVQRLTLSNADNPLPDELSQLTLTTPTLTELQPKAVLDIDLYNEVRLQNQMQDFSIDTIINNLKAKHEITREAFRVAVTDEAIKKWK